MGRLQPWRFPSWRLTDRWRVATGRDGAARRWWRTGLTGDARAELADALIWAALVAAGLTLALVAVRQHAALGTRSAPFLGSYRLSLGLASLLAPAVAWAVLQRSHEGRFDTVRWRSLLGVAWGASLAWSLSLALVDGEAGLTRSLINPDNYLNSLPPSGTSLTGFIASYNANAASHSIAARGHPPGPVVLLWGLAELGIRDRLVLGLLIAAIGAAITPLVLVALRGVCGELAARRYAPVLILAPYAVWVAVSVDVVVASLGALMVALGVLASARHRTGPRAAGYALACGLVLGVAAMFSYAAAWLGLSVVCLYFARRRASLNLVTGLGALVPALLARALGFNWSRGLELARTDFAVRVEPHRSVLWWSALSLVVLLCAAGPPLVRSLRRLRNTPGWPFLVGSAAAVLFSLTFGLARGGVEAAWLQFFPWLTVAAVAPTTQAGRIPRTPLLLVGLGAATSIVIEALLATPW